MFIVVFLLILCVVGVAHWYLWRRLVRDTSSPGSWWRRVGTVLIVLMPALLVAAQSTGRSGVPYWLQAALAWPGLMWFAVLVYLLLTTVALEAVRPLALRWSRRRDAARTEPATERSGPDPTAAEAGEHAGAEDDTSTTRSATQSSTPPLLGPDDAERSADSGGTTATVVAPESPSRPAGATPTGARRADGAHGETPQGTHGGGTGEDDPRDTSRRLFLSRAVAVTAGTVTAVTVGSGAYSVLAAGPTVKHVDVHLAKLPPAADGYRITLISDIHLSPLVGRGVTERIVRRANATHPDLTVLAGDLVDGTVTNLRDAAAPLGELTAREGVFFSTGNHEYYSGYQEWNAHLADALGVRVLRNQRAELRHFDLAGVNDLAGEEFDDGPDLTKALAGRDQERPVVLIAHQPAMIDEAREHDVDLQLSGHTHGGQMWPGNFLAALANPTLAGLESYGDTQLYVSRGAGAWGPPVRVGAEPDIAVLTLRSRRS